MKSALLLIGLLACIPQPKPTEAPAVINVPPLPKSEERPELPVYSPQWTIIKLGYLPEEIVVDPTKVIYKMNSSQATVHSISGKLWVACEGGLSMVVLCTANGSTDITCSDIALRVSCEYKKFGTEEIESIPKEESDTQ